VSGCTSAFRHLDIFTFLVISSQPRNKDYLH
jgi:hypothetical protein